MRGAVLIIAISVLTTVNARAGSFTCSSSNDAPIADVLSSPRNFVGQCLRMRGILSAAPKVGAVLRSPADSIRDDANFITIYFEDDSGPKDLDERPRNIEVAGRVLTCGDIGKDSMESADRANAREEARPHGPNDPQVFYIGVPPGACHYRDDMFAVLVTSFRLLPTPLPKQ